MTDDIRYDKTFDLLPGRAAEVAPGVRAVVANNPGPFTFKGTVSYIIGRGKVAILDPGPDDDAHIAALLDAVRGETRKARTARHDRCISARRIGSTPAPTWISAPTSRLPTGMWSPAMAGPWRR